MYKYFILDELEQSVPLVQLRGDIVPLYDEHGEFVSCVVPWFQPIYSNVGEVTGYIRKPKMRLDESTMRQLSGKTFWVN
jgi:hypothetical protein